MRQKCSTATVSDIKNKNCIFYEISSMEEKPSAGSMLLNVVWKNEQTRRVHLKQEGALQLDGQKIPEGSCGWYRFSIPLKTSLQMRGLFIKQKWSIVFMLFCKGKAK